MSGHKTPPRSDRGACGVDKRRKLLHQIKSTEFNTHRPATIRVGLDNAMQVHNTLDRHGKRKKCIGVIVDFDNIPIGKLQAHGHHVVTAKIGIQLPLQRPNGVRDQGSPRPIHAVTIMLVERLRRIERDIKLDVRVRATEKARPYAVDPIVPG